MSGGGHRDSQEQGRVARPLLALLNLPNSR